MPSTLTEDQRGDYLLNKGTACPHCGSDKIEAEAELDFNNGVAHEIHCVTCDARWFNVYTLSDIIPL